MMRRYRKELLLLLIIWWCVAGGLVFLMALAFRSFENLPLGFACYISSFGYLLLQISGPCFHTLYPSEWQWITGLAIMLLLSILASFPQNRTVRIVAMVLFIILHLAGSFCSFGSMICAIT